MSVAGVDGCLAGWLIVICSDGGQIEALSIVPNFVLLLEATRHCHAVAVDIPIGLSETWPRRADTLARSLLRPGKTSSVFPSPLRPVLAAATYDEACMISRDVSGRAISRQTYALLDKIREADASMTPALQQRVFESHPEVDFRALNGGKPVLSRKRSLEGQAEREQLLDATLGTPASNLRLPSGAARDDLYDACALTWTAARLARGEAVHLPATADYDSRGLRMEIVY